MLAVTRFGGADGFLTGAVVGFVAGGITSQACFVAGTLITTEYGLKPIEEIEAGQMVWADDPDTGERALKRVVRTFRNEKDELVHVTVNGEEIVCTTEHPFYVHGKGWVAAKDLRIDDQVELLNGLVAYISCVEYETPAEPIKVYNFEVEGFHTYFVGSTCILVHNICSSKGTHNPKVAEAAKKGKRYACKLELWARSRERSGYKRRIKWYGSH